MAFPIENLLKKVDSKYRLAIIVAERAKQLSKMKEKPPSKYSKLTNMALEEIAQGKVKWREKGSEK